MRASSPSFREMLESLEGRSLSIHTVDGELMVVGPSLGRTTPRLTALQPMPPAGWQNLS